MKTSIKELMNWIDSSQKIGKRIHKRAMNIWICMKPELSGKCENCLSFYQTPIRMDMIKKHMAPNANGNVGEKVTLTHCWWQRA